MYEDGDADGVGAGARSVLCTGAGIPDGLSIRGYDSDDEDPTVTEDDLSIALLP